MTGEREPPRDSSSRTRLLVFFLFLAAFAALFRFCYLDVLWAEENLPLAAAAQVRQGAVLYRDAWFDKPPLLALAYLLCGAAAGWPLRLLGTAYVLLASWLAYGFARDVGGRAEGLWAAALLAFFLTFDFHAAAVPLAADLLMLAPHLAAVWLAWKGRPFWSGLLCAAAFSINAKGVFVLAACALWASWPRLLGGFAAGSAALLGWLSLEGALGAYVQQVWRWPSLYAADTFVENPLLHGLARTASWAGFHAALIAAARWPARGRWKWAAWAALSLAATVVGLRFFERYYFQLLPVAVMLAARGLAAPGRWRLAALPLLLIPLIRFGPRYFSHSGWADLAMDRDSRQASALVRSRARSGDTLFVWGFRPEMFVYTGLRAGTRFLESQPLTGVAADRHLKQERSLMPETGAENRRELARSRPTFVIDGLGPYNPSLAVTRYPDLREWLSAYEETGRTQGAVIYRRKSPLAAIGRRPAAR